VFSIQAIQINSYSVFCARYRTSIWRPKLEKTLEPYGEESHNSYRVYMSAEPAPIPESYILESSIKITNEPPQLLEYAC